MFYWIKSALYFISSRTCCCVCSHFTWRNKLSKPLFYIISACNVCSWELCHFLSVHTTAGSHRHQHTGPEQTKVSTRRMPSNFPWTWATWARVFCSECSFSLYVCVWECPVFLISHLCLHLPDSNLISTISWAHPGHDQKGMEPTDRCELDACKNVMLGQVVVISLHEFKWTSLWLSDHFVCPDHIRSKRAPCSQANNTQKQRATNHLSIHCQGDWKTIPKGFQCKGNLNSKQNVDCALIASFH